jgi:hypothetical protein
LILPTKGWIFFISRSFLEPTNFLTSVSSIDEFNGRGDVEAMPCSRVRQPEM